MEDATMLQVDVDAIMITIEESSSRGLVSNAKWLAELLPEAKTATSPVPNVSGREIVPKVLSQRYLLAKCFFDCREYTRCSTYLASNDLSDQRSLFLGFYARYLAGEKEREEGGETVLGPRDGKIDNPHMVSLTVELEKLHSNNQCDSYLYFLYGMLRRKLDQIQDAIEILLLAISCNPYNWAAWQELSACMPDAASINKALANLPDHPLARMFNVATLLDLHLSSDELQSQLSDLDEMFPGSLYLKTLRAILAYNAQDFEAAESIFDEIVKIDPCRLDSIDVYSNVLFVLERRAKLGHLAKTVYNMDKFRSETCCVVGNYYSLMSDHEKAVSYFRKALKLNRSYLAAWTLMGHEYVELKNTHAAIESYRRAVDINRKDYRAWYGLGQAYEMLEMHYYALHYFQRAAALKPLDVRMWTAVGNCHEKLGRFGEAIKAYRRSLLGEGALDLLQLLKIGELFERAGDLDAARRQFQACVELSKTDSSVDVTPAQEWLDRYRFDQDSS